MAIGRRFTLDDEERGISRSSLREDEIGIKGSFLDKIMGTKKSRGDSALGSAFRSKKDASKKAKMAAKETSKPAKPAKPAKEVKPVTEAKAATGDKLAIASQLASAGGSEGAAGILGGAASGASLGPAGMIAGAGLGIAKNLAARKQKNKDITAAAMRESGRIVLSTAEGRNRALENIMQGFRDALLG
jgi:hypothetical protein